MTLPLPFATASVAYVMGRTFHRLRQWKLPTPAAVVGALAMDAGIHAARLVYQYNAATHNSQQRASMLAEQLQKLRQQHDYVRVVGHSLGCRHVVEACALLPPKERPNALHLCAPAMTRSDLSPFVHCEAPSLAQEKTVIYYSEKDVTLGLVLRAMWRGEQSVGEIGMPNEKIAPNVHLVNASRSLGGYYVGAHTDYADKFHYFAYPSSPSANKQV
ncbi:hypothetical protein BDF14DRAFT_1769703 [Spinellus fusiger]|nr:hypothetical protein BDF14DRAFT_1769703 [Spinellus fusiger]